MNLVKLDANENLLIPKQLTEELMSKVVKEVDPRLYPSDDQKLELVNKISNYLNIDKEKIVLGTGADQLIDLIVTLFGNKGVTLLYPSFSSYFSACKLHNVPLTTIVFNRDFSVSSDNIFNSIKDSSLFILCRPNNPTGNSIDEDVVLEIAKNFNGIIAIDEVYGEFSDSQLYYLPNEFKNIIVLKSFSKSFGAAGLRIGYLIANESLVETINKYQFLYPVTNFSLKYASYLLDNLKTFKKYWQELKEVRSWFFNELSNINSIEVIPSQTNFVSFLTNIEDFKNRMLLKGYIVREFDGIFGYKKLIRVTLANLGIMKEVSDTIRKIVAEGEKND
ncbi:MAG: aminotransferase class I/II-fold pyridoxal phosphate-dependent enzyme [Thermoproteota archaeon]